MTPRDPTTAKAQLRRQMRRLRAGVDPATLPDLAAAIAVRAAQLPELRAARTISTYLAIRRELPTDALRDRLPGARWAIPRVDGDAMVMVADEGPRVVGAMGIATCAGPEVAVDALVVPGLAFDIAGRRLGWGGGYYDRYLASRGGFAVAIALDEAIVDEVPHGPHDRRVDVIVTPTRILRAVND